MIDHGFLGLWRILGLWGIFEALGVLELLAILGSWVILESLILGLLGILVALWDSCGSGGFWDFWGSGEFVVTWEYLGIWLGSEILRFGGLLWLWGILGI